jgi:hypothetical protein
MSRTDTGDLMDYPIVEGQHVLSVYLQTHSIESLTLFDVQTASIQAHFEEQTEQRDFNECVDRVRRFLARFEARGQTVVIVCNSTGPLWVRQVDVLLPNDVRWDREPNWRPLIEALDEFEPYGVIAVERFKARLFTMSVGGIHEHLTIQRTSEDLDGFLQKVIAATQELMQTECPNRLIVSGDRDIRTEFLRLAPWALQQSVVASTGIPEDASAQRILDATQELNRCAERRYETKQVEELLRLAARHKKVTLGLQATLDAVSAGRVWTLIYSENLRLAGTDCELCKRLFADDVVTCPDCNVATRQVSDLVSLAVTRVLYSDASIEQVRGAAAHRLNEAGGIGAFLRY